MMRSFFVIIGCLICVVSESSPLKPSYPIVSEWGEELEEKRFKDFEKQGVKDLERTERMERESKRNPNSIYWEKRLNEEEKKREAAAMREVVRKRAEEYHRNTFAGKREQAEKEYLERDNRALFPGLARDLGMQPLKTKAEELVRAIDWEGVETVYRNLIQIIETARFARGISGKEGDLNKIRKKFLEDWARACSRLNAHYGDYRKFGVSLSDDESRNLLNSYFDEEASKIVSRTFGSTAKTLVERAGELAKDVGVEFPYDLILPNRYRGFGGTEATIALKRSQDGKDGKREKRKICVCSSPDVFFAGVCRKKVGVIKNRLWAQYYCRNCGGFRRGSMFELMKTDMGVSVCPAGSVPSDWDGKIYEQSELDARVRGVKNGVKLESENVVEEKANTGVNQQTKTGDSQVGVRGWCKCQKKDIDDGVAKVGPWWYGSFGRKKYDEQGIECDLAYFICCKCGRVVHPDDRTIRKEELKIFDVKLYKDIRKQHGNIVWRKAVIPLTKRQDQIAAIPDGQIIVSGKCVCKKENAILAHVGNNKTGDFHVCIICGHVRSPDAIVGIQCVEENE